MTVSDVLWLFSCFWWAVMGFSVSKLHSRYRAKLPGYPKAALPQGDPEPSPLCHCGGEWNPWVKTKADTWDSSGTLVTRDRDMLERECQECHYVERRKLKAIS